MTRTQANNDGQLEMMLTCPVCDFDDVVYYTYRRPVYCSDSCKAKAYRLRKQRKNVGVTLLPDWRDAGLDSHIPALLTILDRHGPDAARAAGELAMAVRRENNKERMRMT